MEIVNRHSHGYVSVPVILARNESNSFIEWVQNKQQTKQRENKGNILVGLKMLETIGWLQYDQEGKHSLTSKAQKELIPILKHSEFLLEIYKIPEKNFESYLRGSTLEPVEEKAITYCITESIQEWGITDNKWLIDFLDGVIIIPLLLVLTRSGFLESSKNNAIFSEIHNVKVHDLLVNLFNKKKLAERGPGGRPYLSELGLFITSRALNYGTVASYRVMWHHSATLLFGDPLTVFRRDDDGHELHVDRSLNVIASGFQHKRFFEALSQFVVAIFDQLPLENQPRYICDMGCGDGTLLGYLYEAVVKNSARGQRLKEFPLVLVGCDFNEKALEETRKTLGGLGFPHRTIWADIGDPKTMVEAFRKNGITDVERVLHVRSFLDHNRPYIAPRGECALMKAPVEKGGSVFVGENGEIIPGKDMTGSLVEHMQRWSEVLSPHGLIILEVHCLSSNIVNKYLDECESLHYDLFHSFSKQYLVPADHFLLACAEAGLFPKNLQRFPRHLPYTRITLGWYEKKPFIVRLARIDDIPHLVELETLCWVAPLRASAETLSERISANPSGNYVLVNEGRLVAALYLQRITSVDAFVGKTFRDEPTLRNPSGTVLQLVMYNVHPHFTNQEHTDFLLKFGLSIASLDADLVQVVGISRCNNFGRRTDITLEEYIRSRNPNTHKLLDPILCSHESRGAKIGRIVPGYRPEDEENLGHGVLIRYPLKGETGEEKEEATTKTEETANLKTIVPNEIDPEIARRISEMIISTIASKLFTNDKTLMELGFDPTDLSDLRVKISKLYKLEIDPTFFFTYTTPKLIAKFISDQVALSKANPELENVPDDIIQSIISLIRGVVQRPLGSISPTTTLRSLGLDSVDLMELHQKLSLSFHVTLPMLFLFDCPTPRAMASYLANSANQPSSGNTGLLNPAPTISTTATATTAKTVTVPTTITTVTPTTPATTATSATTPTTTATPATTTIPTTPTTATPATPTTSATPATPATSATSATPAIPTTSAEPVAQPPKHNPKVARPEVVQQVYEAIKKFVPPHMMRQFTMDKQLKQMGLNEEHFAQLRNQFSKTYNMKMDPNFFLIFSNGNAVALFFSNKTYQNK